MSSLLKKSLSAFWKKQPENVTLIVGLGNPGQEYARSRHNVGFMCINRIARNCHISLDKKIAKARSGIGEIDSTAIVLAKPQTYMNLSGESVRLLVNKFKPENDRIIVIHDDLDLPVGKLRIRQGSGAGGHRGVSSIINCLGTKEFIRFRIGIGKPAPDDFDQSEDDIVDYVLDSFPPDEEKLIEAAMQQAVEAVQCLLSEGLETVMNRFN